MHVRCARVFQPKNKEIWRKITMTIKIKSSAVCTANSLRGGTNAVCMRWCWKLLNDVATVDNKGDDDDDHYDDDDDDDKFYMTFSTSLLTMLVHMSAEKAVCCGTWYYEMFFFGGGGIQNSFWYSRRSWSLYVTVSWICSNNCVFLLCAELCDLRCAFGLCIRWRLFFLPCETVTKVDTWWLRWR